MLNSIDNSYYSGCQFHIQIGLNNKFTFRNLFVEGKDRRGWLNLLKLREVKTLLTADDNYCISNISLSDYFNN